MMNTVSNCTVDNHALIHNEHSEATAVAIADAVKELSKVLANISKGFESPVMDSAFRFGV